MIFWENIRFSCDACNKGHRSTKCMHINRMVSEIKSKGRPQSQCPSCRTKRIEGSGHSHHKCRCGQEPPKEYVVILSIFFANGLRLQFQPKSGFDIIGLRLKVEQKTPFPIKLVKGKDPGPDDQVQYLVPIELKEDREESKASLDAIFNNPCKCHYGGSCICSDLPQKKKTTDDPNPLPLFAKAVTSLESSPPIPAKQSSSSIYALLNPVPSIPVRVKSGCCSKDPSPPPSTAPNSCCGSMAESCCSGGCFCNQNDYGCQCAH